MLALLLIVLLITMLAGFPAAFCLGGVSLLFAFLGIYTGHFDAALLGTLPSRLFGLMQNELLIAVPLFVFMGNVLQCSGVADDMLTALNRLCRRLPAGLGLSLMLVGALLAASTGIVGATVVTMGIISLPAMLNAGYDKKLACGSVCAAGTLGQIIPPSIVLILLADQISSAYQGAMMKTGNFSADPVSVSDVFTAALTPGLLLVALYMLWFVIIRLIKPEAAPAYTAPVKRHAEERVIAALKAVAPPIALIMLVLGSILFGFATATEAASAGAAGACVIAALRRRLCLKTLRQASRDTGQVTAMLFTLLIGASIFSLVFRGFGGEHVVQEALSDLPGGMYGALILVLAVIFVLGFLLDFIEIIYIVIPIVIPVLVMQGADPLWLAALIAMNLQTSFLTPPFGFSLFYLKSVAPPEIRTSDIYKGVLPFIGIQMMMLLIVLFFPALALYPFGERKIITPSDPAAITEEAPAAPVYTPDF